MVKAVRVVRAVMVEREDRIVTMAKAPPHMVARVDPMT